MPRRRGEPIPPERRRPSCRPVTGRRRGRRAPGRGRCSPRAPRPRTMEPAPRQGTSGSGSISLSPAGGARTRGAVGSARPIPPTTSTEPAPRPGPSGCGGGSSFSIIPAAWALMAPGSGRRRRMAREPARCLCRGSAPMPAAGGGTRAGGGGSRASPTRGSEGGLPVSLLPLASQKAAHQCSRRRRRRWRRRRRRSCRRGVSSTASSRRSTGPSSTRCLVLRQRPVAPLALGLL